MIFYLRVSNPTPSLIKSNLTELDMSIAKSKRFKRVYEILRKGRIGWWRKEYNSILCLQKDRPVAARKVKALAIFLLNVKKQMRTSTMKENETLAFQLSMIHIFLQLATGPFSDYFWIAAVVFNLLMPN